MKKLIFVLPVILVCALMVEAAGPKALTRTIQASDIDTLDLSSGIGDVTITAREGLDEVAIEVVLTPRRGGIFSSKRQAERDVEAASLEAAVKRESLKLRISPGDDDDQRFEEKWIIEMPSRLAIKLDHGVGDIVIKGSTAGIELDSGVIEGPRSESRRLRQGVPRSQSESGPTPAEGDLQTLHRPLIPGGE